MTKACDYCSTHWNGERCERRIASGAHIDASRAPDMNDCPSRRMYGVGFTIGACHIHNVAMPTGRCGECARERERMLYALGWDRKGSYRIDWEALERDPIQPDRSRHV